MRHEPRVGGPPRGPTELYRLGLWAVAATALTARLAAALAVDGLRHPGLEEYEEIARNLLAGRGFTFLHLGIATRSFERRFELADFVRVDDARLNDGLLTIELIREVPVALKPQTIAIKTGAPLAAIESDVAEETKAA